MAREGLIAFTASSFECVQSGIECLGRINRKTERKKCRLGGSIINKHNSIFFFFGFLLKQKEKSCSFFTSSSVVNSL